MGVMGRGVGCRQQQAADAVAGSAGIAGAALVLQGWVTTAVGAVGLKQEKERLGLVLSEAVGGSSSGGGSDLSGPIPCQESKCRPIYSSKCWFWGVFSLKAKEPLHPLSFGLTWFPWELTRKL